MESRLLRQRLRRADSRRRLRVSKIVGKGDFEKLGIIRRKTNVVRGFVKASCHFGKELPHLKISGW